MKNVFSKIMDGFVKMKSSVMAAVIGGISVFMASAAPVAADGDIDIVSNMQSVMDTYYVQFVAFSTVLALFVVVVGVIWVMLSPSSKGAATPLGWIKKVVICWLVIQCLGGLFAIAKQVAGSNGMSSINIKKDGSTGSESKATKKSTTKKTTTKKAKK